MKITKMVETTLSTLTEVIQVEKDDSIFVKLYDIISFSHARDIYDIGAFHLRTSVYLLRALIPSFAHDSAYHLRTFFTPH